MSDYLSTFRKFIKEIENAVALHKGATFLVCSPELCCIIQDSSHYHISTNSFYNGGKFYNAGKFINLDLLVDTNLNDDYVLRFGFGAPDVRKIIIDRLLGDEMREETLDLSHHKLIIK